MTNETALRKVLNDDEIQALVDANLYEYDENGSRASPNFRYCKPETPSYVYDWDRALWCLEASDA